MQFEPSNFYSNFNQDNRIKNYSHEEVIFEIEIKARLKKESLLDKKIVKQVSENDIVCPIGLNQSRV